MTTTLTRYEIKTGPEHGSGQRPWMALPSTLGINPRSLGAWCYYEATTTDLVALEAALEADDDVIEYREIPAQHVIDAVRAHGEREGRNDYTQRAGDVAAGQQPEEWAWPFVGADEAYLNAVRSEDICREIGVSDDAWEDICTEWLEAFERGYKAAHHDQGSK